MDLPSLQQLAFDLFGAIHALSGYPVPATLPPIQAVPVEVMQQKACGKPCAVKAFYHPEWGVFFDEKMDLAANDFDRSVLLHELVHYLQSTGGRFEKMPITCERNQLAEAEAYKIQNLYLSSVNSARRALFTGWTGTCAESRTAPARD
jgi:hypothetical protein